MHKVAISEVQPGMILAKPVYNNSGKILLAQGVELNDSFINRLKDMGIPAVYIKSELMEDVEIPEVLPDLTRVQAQMTVKDVFNKIDQCGKVSLGNTRKSVNNIVDEVLKNHEVMVHLTDIRSKDNEVFGHCVNVAMLSIMVGIDLGYNQLQLRDLGIGCILHDLGKLHVDHKVLKKNGRLTEPEFETIKEHSRLGFDIIRSQEDTSLLAAHVAFQHHEKYDGSGYPRGLKGTAIHEFARIAAIADVFDAMTSDRAYRPAYSTSEVIQTILEAEGKHFDPGITKVFIKHIAKYPIGSIVLLSSGEIGVVVEYNEELPDRPVINIIIDKNKQPVREICREDLAHKSNLRIVKTINGIGKILPSITDIGSRIINQKVN